MSEERKHSILAPSSKEWVHCGFSAKFLANKEEETNDASEFGTECHALAEAYIRQSLKIEDFDEKTVGIEELKTSFAHYDEEMESLATGYANFVIGQADYEEKRTGRKPIVFVEQLLEMDYAPDTHGTADAIIISGDTLTIIDNKTGFVPVYVFEDDGSINSQLGIYGLYAYKLFADIYPIRKIRLVIYQERIHNIDDRTVEVEDLLEWEVSVLRPAAKEAQNPNAEAISGKWCKYCPGRNVCRQRSEDASSVDIEKKPDTMTDSEIEELLPRLDFVIDYCNSVKEYALKKAMDRASGSGVFARDPDAQLDLIQLDTDEDFMLKNADNPNSTAWRLECSLREFENFKPVNLWFEYPLHKADTAGVLSSVGAEGSVEANLAKSGKRKSTPETRREEFDNAYDALLGTDSSVSAKDMAEYLGIAERTIRDRLKELEDTYHYAKGRIYRNGK